MYFTIIKGFRSQNFQNQVVILTIQPEAESPQCNCWDFVFLVSPFKCYLNNSRDHLLTKLLPCPSNSTSMTHLDLHRIWGHDHYQNFSVAHILSMPKENFLNHPVPTSYCFLLSWESDDNSLKDFDFFVCSSTSQCSICN